MRVAAFDETLDDLLLDRASQADQERRLGLVVETAQRVRGEATRPAAN
jgi:hypothetical protein